MRSASITKDPTFVSAWTDTKATAKRATMTTNVVEILATPTQFAEIQTARTPAAANPVFKETESGVRTITSAKRVFMIATKKPSV